MRIVCFVLVLFALCGCANHEDQAKLRQIEVEYLVQGRLLEAHSKELGKLGKEVEALRKEIGEVPKWK